MKQHNSCAWFVVVLCLCCLVATPAAGQATFPMVDGELVATCFSGFNVPNNPSSGINTSNFVVGVMDVRDPPCCGNPVPVVDTNWLAPMFHNEFPVTANTWSAANLGQVFGVCLDDQLPPNIYVAATTAYGAHPFSANGPGAVFKLNGTTGAITPFTVTGTGLTGTNTLDNTGPGLGNICHNPAFNQFFISNFENGEITRHDANGVILSRLDPFTPDSGSPGFAPLGERIWGLQVYNSRLYFGVWLRDDGRTSTPAAPTPASTNNTVWSVQLSGTGDFVGAPVLEIVMPPMLTVSWSNPVSDIAFNAAGEMLLGERTMGGDLGILGAAHRSRVLQYVFSAGWVPTGTDFYIGRDITGYGGERINSSGGIDYDCDDNVWSTGDALHYTFGDYIYGLQRVPASGNTNLTATSTSYLVDADGNTTSVAKTFIGDCEVYKLNPCGNPLETCPLRPGEDYCLAMQDSECQTPLPTNANCVPTVITVDSEVAGGFTITDCDCVEDCGEISIINNMFRCVNECTMPGELCQIYLDGVPQGVTFLTASSVSDGVQVTCGCGDPMPQFCPLPPTDQFCGPLQNLDCLDDGSGGECLLKALLVDFNMPGIYMGVECDCVNGCGEVQVNGDLISCPGVCPIPPGGEICQIHYDGVPQGITSVVNTAVPNGTIVTCDCQEDPPNICQSSDGVNCDPFMCPVAGEQCAPRCVKQVQGVWVIEDCECQDVSQDCHVIFGGGVEPFCDSNCPPGEICVRSETYDPLTGELIVCCECVPEEECEPTDDGTGCKPTVCPDPAEECIPKCVRLDAAGQFEVIHCDCDMPEACRIELTPGAQPTCVGDCPPGMVCVQSVFSTPNGTEYCCECVDDPPFCVETPDRQDCEPFDCPDPGDECRPRCIREDPAAGTYEVINCDCRPADECHAEFIPGVGVRCEGDCPPGFTCIENRIDNGDGTFDICCECVRRPCKCPGDVDGNGLVNGDDIQGFVDCFLGVAGPEDNCTCADMDGDGDVDFNDVIAFVTRLLSDEPCFDSPCPPEDLVLNLATGVDDDDGTFIPIGNDDDNWVVTCDASGGAVPRPAIVIPANSAWVTIPGTGWISANATGPNGDYCYQYCFCLDPRFSNPQLNIQIRADDQASVFLNGTLLGTTPNPGFNTGTPTIISTSDPSLFQVGENCIEVVVSNINGVVTGFNMAGGVKVTDGKCCCDEEDLVESIASGVDDDGNCFTVGSDDDDWTVTTDAAGGTVPRPATIITPNSAWLTIPGTKWISANATGPNGLYVYEYCFCLDPRFENAVLNLDLRADDRATVCLNGTVIGATPTSYAFNTPTPTNIFVTNQDLFVCGENCIEVKVENTHGVVTGFNIAGMITADKGLCCEEQDCGPNEDGSACRPFKCEKQGQSCLPRCIRVNILTDERTVLDCECRSPDECHVAPDFPPMTLPACLGGCPPGYTCVQDFVDNGDGTFDICCDCVLDPPLGACCLLTGICIVSNQTACEDQLGLYLGDGTVCQGDEACCLPDGSCIVVDVACCTALYNGTPQGPGSVCLGDNDFNGFDDLCQGPPIEYSCCDQAGFCIDLAPGVFQCPPGSFLVVGPCGFQQACCFNDGTCQDQFEACCIANGGTPQGIGTDCTTVTCSGECGQDPFNPTVCQDVLCPLPQDQCVSKCVTYDGASLAVIDLQCQCQGIDQCYVFYDPMLGPRCLGTCPPGQFCEETTVDNGDGTFTFCCMCMDEPPSGSCCDAMGVCIPEPVGGCPPGSTYFPDPCDPIQACCLPNDVCQDLEPKCCEAQGGIPVGGMCVGTLEGCCLPDGTCVDVDPACCQSQGGTPTGLPCQPTEACCFVPPYATMCIDTDPGCCMLAGGTPQGFGTACQGDLNMDGIDDACQDPPGQCPLPDTLDGTPPPCTGMEANCINAQPGQECMPTIAISQQGGVAFIEGCTCTYPGACGAITIVGNMISCPGVCPNPLTERCQLVLDGTPVGISSLDLSTIAPGILIECECGP